jgi:hypothetical protein
VPTVLLRLDEDVVMVVLVVGMVGGVRCLAGRRQGRGGKLSVARAVVFDAG